MSAIYTFKDIKASCSHNVPVLLFPGCKHPDNVEKGQTVGHCDENVCPVLRAILDDGEEWE